MAVYGDGLCGLLVTDVTQLKQIFWYQVGYQWLAGMVRGFQMKGWGGLVFGVAGVARCDSCRLDLGLL